jgi:hypothetical protein
MSIRIFVVSDRKTQVSSLATIFPQSSGYFNNFAEMSEQIYFLLFFAKETEHSEMIGLHSNYSTN